MSSRNTVPMRVHREFKQYVKELTTRFNKQAASYGLPQQITTSAVTRLIGKKISKQPASLIAEKKGKRYRFDVKMQELW